MDVFPGKSDPQNSMEALKSHFRQQNPRYRRKYRFLGGFFYERILYAICISFESKFDKVSEYEVTKGHQRSCEVILNFKYLNILLCITKMHTTYISFDGKLNGDFEFKIFRGHSRSCNVKMTQNGFKLVILY